jgi:uncharacterized protein (TIGR03083 family)
VQDTTGSSIRDCFAAASACFTEVVARVPDRAWDHPALGVWNVRDLVGHTGRALSTIETYLEKEPTGDTLDGPVAYFVATRALISDPDAVTRRGREAGAALGEDPVGAIADLARRVTGLVDGTADGASVASPVGTITLVDYLPSRTFELTVHGLDLARTLGVDPPPSLQPAVSASLDLAGRLAGTLGHAPELLLLITGRTGLREGISIV